MDVERFDDAALALLDRLDRRSDPSTRALTREFLEVGEWSLFVDSLAAELVQDQTPIDLTERELLHELLYSFEPRESDAVHLPGIRNRDEVLASLNVVGAAHRRAG